MQASRGGWLEWENAQLEEQWGYIFCSVWTVCEHSLSQQFAFSPRQE